MGEKKLAEYILKQVQGRNLDKDTAIQFLKELQSKDREQDVAIIGMNCRLPDAEDLESFWANLEDGLSSIGDFPEMRKAKIAQYINQQYGQHSPDFLKGGFLSDIDLFDPQFFRISPAEAAHMDPMQRLFLETVYHSIEDAGYAGQNRLPENTGVYVGTDHTHKFKGAYLNLIPDPDFSDMIGSWTGLLASRISYFLNLKGPSIVLDTACSSGLVSIHTACRALQNKECAMAIAGGINLYLAPLNSGLEEIEAEAGSQIVRTFDKDANGMLWGEGVAAIVLKPLNQAVADGDHVYAVIKGSAVNNSGATNGISAPNADAQESVIVRAWENAGIDPQTITYIETFGTGTLVGDSIEVKGITQAFRRYTDAEKFCAIGSVKPNIGHTVAASGLCSVIKVALSLENKLLPPTIHYNEANPLIPFENSPVYVNAQRMPWVTTGEPRRAGVSAFGFSGTNGHLVLEEAPHCVPVQSDDFKILVLAAKKQSSMEELVSRYIRAVEDKRFPSLEELCFTANTGRTHFVEHRMAFVFKNAEELLIQLRKASYERPNSHMSTREGAEEAKRIIDRITSNGPGTEEQLKQLGMLYLNGVDISWTAFYSGRNYNRVSLPVYPYDRQSYWVDGTAELQAATTTAVNPKDRNALNASSVIHLQGRINEKYTDTEIEIVQVWGNVLGYSVLDVNANFFDLGGSSLQAMKIVNYINTRKRMSLTVPDLLSHPSITEFCVHLEAAQHAPATESALSLIRCIEPRDAYELSSSQKRIYVQQKLAENSLMYNLPVMSRVYGNLDIRRLEEAARLLIGRHESFRTHFDVRGNGDIIQKISNDTEPELAYFEADEKDLPLLTQQFVRPFDLHTDNLLRVGVVKYGEQKFILMLDTHHIISDGISIETMIRELISLYANRELPELPCQFKDFVEWQHETAITEAKMGTEQYWRDTLAGELPVLQLPLDDPRPSIQRFDGDRLTFELDEKTTAKLLELAKEEQTTSFTVFLTLFNVLLSRYSGQEDVIVGIPYSGRNLPGVDNVIGMFVNTVPVRSYPKGGKSFVEFLAEVKQATLQSYDNQNYPLEDIIELLSVQRDPSRNPLFDVMFVQQERINQSFDIEGVSFTPYELDNTTSKFDLTLQATPDRGRIKFELEYCTSLFRKETIQRMINHFIRMGQAVAADREIKLSEIPLLSEEESSLLLKWFNNTGISYTLDKPLHRLFEEQAHLREGQRAITSGNGQWTYGEINRRANRLARTLRGKGVKPGTIVGIGVERSMEMMVGLLAALKAGGAYLPIDPGYPAERIRYLLEDSQASLVMTQSRFTALLEEASSVQLLDLEDEGSYASEDTNLEGGAAADDLAYVIYTSGSTGNPKGVMIEHRSAMNRLQWMQRQYPLEAGDVILQKTPFTFDVSVWELFCWFYAGAELHMLTPGGEKDPGALIEAIEQRKVTTLHFVPSMLSAFLEYAEQFGASARLASVKNVFASGEALNAAQVKNFRRLLGGGGSKLHNLYGPTETTVDVTYYDCNEGEVRAAVPIGKPIDNTRIYIVNKERRIQPLGVAGELCIAGAGVARGYLNKPELTAEKFVADPYHPGERMYMTGDLARWLPDGNIEYLGRMDHQVKIRGYRIELGEIEAQLLKMDGVREAVVLAREELGGTLLCAYIVADHEVDLQKLRAELARNLPAYMIPGHLNLIDSLPITSNGKLDRKALLIPEMGLTDSREVTVPATQEEELLSLIWKEVLQGDTPGTTDHFFELGGDSIKAIRVLSRLKAAGYSLELSQFFQNPTIRELALVLHADEVDGKTAEQSVCGPINGTEQLKTAEIIQKIGAGPQGGVYPVTPLQRGIWFDCELHPNSQAYIQQITFEMVDITDIGVFQQAFQELIRQHDVFRTVFVLGEDNDLLQAVLETADLEVEIEPGVLTPAEFELALNVVRDRHRSEGFNLRTGPLMRCSALHCGENRYTIVWSFHHILMDGWCMHLIINALVKNMVLLRQQLPLETGKVQYSSYVEWLNRQDQTKALGFWTKYLEGVEELTELPYQTMRPIEDEYIFDERTYTLGTELTKKLAGLAQKYKVTLNSVLQTAWGIMLQKFNNRRDVVFGNVVSGRDADVLDIEQMVGLTINTVPVRIHAKEQDSFAALLRRVQQEALDSVPYRSCPLYDIQSSSLLNKDLIQHLFVFQNIPNKAPTDTESPDIFIRDVKVYEQTNGYEFCVAVFPDDNVKIRFGFNSAIFPAEKVEDIYSYFRNILTGIAGSPDQLIDDLELAGSEERNRLITAFNPLPVPYAQHKPLHRLFEEQAHLREGQRAITSGNGQWTYGEINRRANRLARTLRGKGVKPGTIVGIGVERSMEMMVGLLAALKAGGAYLPIDPGYPAERIRYLLEDSQASLVMTQSRFTALLEEASSVQLLDLEDEGSYASEDTNLEGGAAADDLAYVIYTSGSTGNPKGVMIEHHSVMNRLQWMQRQYPLEAGDVILQKTPFTFDVSVWELFWWYLAGVELHMLTPGGEKDPGALIEAIKQRKVTTLHFVPSMLSAFLEYAEQFGASARLASVKNVFASGEALNAAQVKNFRRLLGGGGSKLHNLYGPTEATVDVTYYDCSEGEVRAAVPIGKPIDNTRIYIVNKERRIQPLGVAGELCIAGAGVARGYLNKPELTAEKFVADPYHPGERMYMTGDLARWLPDGNIEYLGRMDHQVKIRGYRIELGEIEAQLLKMDGVREAVVLARADSMGSSMLEAFIVSDNKVTIPSCKEHLAHQLPPYMVPSKIMFIDRIPVTPNGKLNRQELLTLHAAGSSGDRYASPQNVTETILAELWKKVLRVDQIGIHDDFFELGGTSLHLISLEAEMNRHDINATLADVSKYKTIKKLADYIISRTLDGSFNPADSKISKDQQISFSMLEQDDNVSHMNWSPDPLNNIIQPAVMDEYKKVLRIVVQTKMSCYLHNAYFLCVLLSYEELIPWYYENYVQLYYAPSKRVRIKEMEEIWLDVYAGWEIPRKWLECRKINRCELEHSSIIGAVESFIDSDNYFHTYIDEYYTVRQGKEHFIHDIFVYGYDREEQQLYTIGYDENRQFRSYKISYTLFEEAFKSGIELSKSMDQLGGESYGLVYSCKLEIIQQNHMFSMENFLTQLYDYLHSVNKSAELLPEEHNMYQFKDNIYGIEVYQPIIRYVRQSQANQTKLDYRPFHLLYEHKMGLVERLQFIQEQGLVPEDILAPLVTKMEEIASRFNTVRLSALRYMFTNDQYLISELLESLEVLSSQEHEVLMGIYQLLHPQVYSSPI